jgi:hypothetical protein
MSTHPVALGQRVIPQQPDFKPIGLWYGIDDSWVEWVKGNTPDWSGDYLYEVKVNSTKILHMSTYEELTEFTSKFGCPISPILPSDRHLYIDWRPIAERWDGIEISPYIWKARRDYLWYYPWDCASGCLWNVTNVELVELDDKTKESIVGKR